ncbi:MAG: patatin-like phospholipase family protein [Anaeromyxobacteraceae bacterium]|nr:patatin-like phospholipase family protein [Anaeromyxobacteraceae bacterium]
MAGERTGGRVGLVLTGGGARAAYQVGVLRAIAEILPAGRIPFDVVTGISAGAINGVAVACNAQDYRAAAAALAETWGGLTPDRIFRTGALKLAATGTRWMRDLGGGGFLGGNSINYLLDPSPLRRLLTEVLPLARMRRHLRAGRLAGVAVSATSYMTGAGVTWFEGDERIRPWQRSSREGLRARLTVEHVMASAAIPVFFPPVKVDEGWYGDGCVRLVYPMSPAIHMGAERILAVSVRHPRAAPGSSATPEGSPLPLSQIAGVLLNAVFLDSIDTDLERLERINRTLAYVPSERVAARELELRTIPVLALHPSQDLGKLAGDEYHRFPAMLRYLLKGIGVTADSGSDLLSYLAFEPVYVARVMELGHADTMARRDEVEAFFRDEPRDDRLRSSA